MTLACGGLFAGHYWIVTTEHTPETGMFYRHTCKRCGAVKDVRVPSFTTRTNGWKPKKGLQ